MEKECFLHVHTYTRSRLLTGKKEEVCHPAMRTIIQQGMQHLASIVLLVADIERVM